MPFTAPADVLREFEKRRQNDPGFGEAFKHDVTSVLFDAIADRIKLGGSVKIFIFGRDNSGKSVSAQVLAKVILLLFKIAGFHTNPELDIDFTPRNYSETNQSYASRIMSPRKNIPFVPIQDENEAMSGHDRLYATQNFLNNMKTIRVLRYNFILCTVDHYKQILSVGTELIGLGFIILETIDQDRRGPLKGTNRLIFHSLEGPLGVVYLDHHGDRKLTEKYEKEKQQAQEQLTGAGGASAAQSNIMQLAHKIYDETLRDITADPLKSQDFKAIANKMQGEGQLSGTSETINNAAWLAFRILYGSHSGREAPSGPEAPVVPALMANGGEAKGTKYSDEGFEENELQNLEEFQELWLDGLYYIPPRTTPEGDPSDYPDVIGILKDGSIGIMNAKNWFWRTGDRIYTHKKMKSELLWHDKLRDRGFTENIRVLLLVRHKQTGLIVIREIPVEKAKQGTYPIRLPKPSPSSPETPPNLPSPTKQEEESEPTRCED